MHLAVVYRQHYQKTVGEMTSLGVLLEHKLAKYFYGM